MSIRPPKLAEHFLTRALPDDIKDFVLGDLEEAFVHQSGSKTKLARQWWYWRQAISTSIYYFSQTQKVLVMFLISMLFFGLVTYFAMYLSGDVSAFIDLPSLIITLPPALFFTIAATSGRRFSQAFTVLLNGHANDMQVIRSSVKIFELFGNSALWLGGIMTVLGWVAIGSQLDDISIFGDAFAVSLLTMLYAMIIKVMCYIAAERVQHIGDMFTVEAENHNSLTTERI